MRRRIHAAQPGQPGIEHDKVRFQIEAKLASLQAFTAFADDLVGRVNAQNFSQHLANGGVVLDYNDSFR